MVQESTVTGKDFLEKDEPKEVKAITLLPGLVSLTFEYFVVKHDQEGKRKEEAWVESWSWRGLDEDDEFTTLEAIKITFEEKGDDPEKENETITTAMTIRCRPRRRSRCPPLPLRAVEWDLHRGAVCLLMGSRGGRTMHRFSRG